MPKMLSASEDAFRMMPQRPVAVVSNDLFGFVEPAFVALAVVFKVNLLDAQGLQGRNERWLRGFQATLASGQHLSVTLQIVVHVGSPPSWPEPFQPMQAKERGG
jgi:hypothetical protein